MSAYNIAQYVKNPVTGVEGGALQVDNKLFNVEDIWYTSNCSLFYSEFLDLQPSDIAEIALELFDAGLITGIK